MIVGKQTANRLSEKYLYQAGYAGGHHYHGEQDELL